MSQPLAHLYALALRALDEQDRRADALRGRLGPVLAAAGLGASLLSGPVAGATHSASIAGKGAIAMTVGGLLLMTTSAFRLLSVRHRLTDRIDPRRLTRELEQRGALDDEMAFYETMIARIGREVDRGALALQQLAAAFTAVLCGILMMLCGLAFAAIVG